MTQEGGGGGEGGAGVRAEVGAGPGAGPPGSCSGLAFAFTRRHRIKMPFVLLLPALLIVYMTLLFFHEDVF